MPDLAVTRNTVGPALLALIAGAGDRTFDTPQTCFAGSANEAKLPLRDKPAPGVVLL